MIDILLQRQLSLAQINNFLSDVFLCSVDRVKVFDIDEFNSLTEVLEDSALDCICVVLPVRGDVSQLLQLYRYRMDSSEVVSRIFSTAQEGGIRCYIPSDSSDVWIYVGDGSSKKYYRQLESDEEDCFSFQLI